MGQRAKVKRIYLIEVIKAKIMAIIQNKKTFVENPLDILKILIPTLLLIFVVIAVITVLMTDEQTVLRSRNGSPISVESFIFVIFGAVAILFGILFLVLSLMKKRTVACDIKGCQIDGVDFWGSKAKTESFLWNEIKDTNLTLDRVPKGREQLSFKIAANDLQTRLLTLTVFNRQDFDDLIETFKKGQLEKLADDGVNSSSSDKTTNSKTPNQKGTPKIVSGGVINGKALNLVQPAYPSAAKAVHAGGAVNVQVLIDENGNVTSASATSGHPLLRSVAVAAARSSKFTPTKLSG